MINDKKEKSPIGWVAWVASLLVITGIIFFIIASTTQKKTISNNTTPTSQLQKPARRMSGTFVVPAGKGPEEIKVWINPREMVWLAANPKAKLFDCKTGQTIEISPNGWTSRPITKGGYLTFFKGSKTTQVDYSIIN